MKSHLGDKTILRSSYLHNGISYTGEAIYLYWIRALEGFPVAAISQIIEKVQSNLTIR